MSRAGVLSAAKTLVQATYTRTYRYGDDYASVVNTVPFCIIEEATGIINTTAQKDSIAAEFSRQWTLGIHCYAAAGESHWSSTTHAAARTAAYAMRDAVIGIIKDNPTLSGTIEHIGQSYEQVIITDIVGLLTWNDEPMFGAVVLVDVMEDI